MFVRFALSVAALAVTFPATAGTQPDQKVEQRMRQMTEVMFQNYPPRALAAKEQGSVFFTVTVDDKGHPTSCQVTRGSGFPLLDEETCMMITRHGTFKMVIGPDGKMKQSSHEGVVNWRIPGAPPPPPVKPLQVAAMDKPEKQICRRTQKTGTLGGWTRTCATEAEWEKHRQDLRDAWGNLNGRKGSPRAE